MPKVVLVHGNPIDGIEIIGKFDSVEEAASYADDAEEVGQEWWTTAIYEPGEDRV